MDWRARVCRLGTITLEFMGESTGGKRGGPSTRIPGSILEGVAEQLVDLFFQGPVVADAPAALAGLFGREGFGGALSQDKAGPAVIGAMELGGLGLAGAVGFAAGGTGGGEAAGEEGEGDVKGDLFLLHLS